MKTYKFKARIEGASVGGACVYFPYDVEEEFGTKGRVPVKATFDGVPYSGSLVKYGAPQHMLGDIEEYSRADRQRARATRSTSRSRRTNPSAPSKCRRSSRSC